MNRATADNQSAQAQEEGLAPTKEWVKDLIDQIIAEEFASPDLELVWLAEEDNDLGKNEAALESRVKLGALTLNELRDALGLDPYTNAAADRPMVLTATGYVPIEAGISSSSPAGGEPRGAIAAGTPSTRGSMQPHSPNEAIEKYNPDQPRVPAGNSDGGQWTSGDSGEDGGSGDPSNSSDANNGARPNSIANPIRYAALDTGTRTDATEDGGRNAGSNNAVLLAGDPVKPGGLIIAPAQLR